MITEFKNFIMRGNVLELAVAVIIAGAFGAIVTSFTNDILFPPIGMLMGDLDMTQMKYVLQAAESDASGAVVAEEVAIRWGQWLKYIIDFIIIAFVLFMIIKAYNKANPKEETAPAPAGPSTEDLLTEIRDLLKKQ